MTDLAIIHRDLDRKLQRDLCRLLSDSAGLRAALGDSKPQFDVMAAALLALVAWETEQQIGMDSLVHSAALAVSMVEFLLRRQFASAIVENPMESRTYAVALVQFQMKEQQMEAAP